jgi:hypothetical protein
MVRKMLPLVMVLSIGVFAVSAQAGDLDGHADAYASGSSPFSANGFQGYVDYAVFMPGSFPYAGYSPDAGEAVYAYQVFDTGDVPLNIFFAVLTDEANDIGSFVDLSGVTPSLMQLFGPPGQARWTFADPNIQPSENSIGLAFSSTKLPTMYLGGVIDGGYAEYVNVLVPGPDDIPEPMTMAFLAAGGVVLFARRRRK